MTRSARMVIPSLVVGVLLAPAGAREAPDSRAELLELVESGGLTRGQLANLYASLSGVSYQPPACVAGQEMFTDVPASDLFCRWIEELARRGITGGCTPTQYCPNAAVTRAQMAVFVVRAMEACPTLDPTDEMIRVGGVCIDKYEASLWDAPVGGNQITGAIPCSENGQDCTNIYARSVAGVLPRVSITWFQAQRALANSGKRLPTNAESQMAISGTPDNTNCNVSTGSVADTGSFGNCVSAFGAHDMVGNLWEWVADWGDNAVSCTIWSSAYGDDLSCVGLGDGEGEQPPSRRTASWRQLRQRLARGVVRGQRRRPAVEPVLGSRVPRCALVVLGPLALCVLAARPPDVTRRDEES